MKNISSGARCAVGWRAMIWLLALVAGVTANQCTDDLEAIVVNSAWQGMWYSAYLSTMHVWSLIRCVHWTEMKTGIDKANEDASKSACRNQEILASSKTWFVDVCNSIGSKFQAPIVHVFIRFSFKVDQMATCLNSDSACTRTVTLKSGVDAERKTCISNVPSTKHHTVANTVMCRDR